MQCTDRRRQHERHEPCARPKAKNAQIVPPQSDGSWALEQSTASRNRVAQSNREEWVGKGLRRCGTKKDESGILSTRSTQCEGSRRTDHSRETVCDLAVGRLTSKELDHNASEAPYVRGGRCALQLDHLGRH